MRLDYIWNILKKNFGQPCESPDMIQEQTRQLSFVIFGVKSNYLAEIWLKDFNKKNRIEHWQ